MIAAALCGGSRVRVGFVLRRALLGFALCVVPVGAILWQIATPGAGWDFHVFFDAGRAYLHGRSPYPQATLAAVAAKDVFVYPAPAAALVAPLSLLPWSLAVVLWELVSVGAVVAALRVVGVRDVRCYGAAFLAAPALSSIRLGTMEPLLLLGLALLWRYRDRHLPAAAAAAALIVAKLFLWPLLLWLFLSGRRRAAIEGAVLATTTAIIAWLPLGFGSLRAYPGVLGALSRYEETFALSPKTLALSLGLGRSLAAAVAYAVGVLLLGLLVRRRHDDLLGFRLALGAAFALSPIAWGHYWLLLLVPVALRSPTLSPIWFAAAWLPIDSLFCDTTPAPWIGLALGAACVQLGFVPRLRLRRSFVTAASAAVVLALTATVLALTDISNPRVASLVPAGAGSGHVEVQLRLRAHRACWAAWADGAPAGGVAVLRSRDTTIPLQGFRFGSTATARGCAAASGLADVIDRSGSYRVEVSFGDGTRLAGPLRRPARAADGGL